MPVTVQRSSLSARSRSGLIKLRLTRSLSAGPARVLSPSEAPSDMVTDRYADGGGICKASAVT